MNNFIVIENGKINTYKLDDKLKWEIGRVSGTHKPDIRCYSLTVSRNHGTLENMDGVWFFVDNNGKNGTVHNDKKLKPNRQGKKKMVMLNDGDIFVFGGSDEAIISPKTVWAMYTTKDMGNDWRIVDTKGCITFEFSDGESSERVDIPSKGMVIKKEKGMAIYMGDVTFIMGNMKVEAQ